MQILENIKNGSTDLTESEVLALLHIKNNSRQFYELLFLSDQLSRKKFHTKGYVFAQIGINAEPCSKNCRFCSMGSSHYVLDASWQKNAQTIQDELQVLLKQGIDDFFLMTTADYPVAQFIRIAEAARKVLPEHIRFVANIGDFDFETAQTLKNIGITGAYHINRLREGRDTRIESATREKTLENILRAGLELYYCIEPIGPEHSYEELSKEIMRAKNMQIAVMAAMRRIPVPGTPLFAYGKISATELTKIVAVTNLAVNPSRAMNVHEPVQMALLAGVNQLYAEVGANPRDVQSNTEENRGFTPEKAWEMLAESGYTQ
ncbi:MAG: radical SAM protein [Desulfobulbaceae bacterium]|nr:radical SAM protein [Desulfobulbaceae bacterium]